MSRVVWLPSDYLNPKVLEINQPLTRGSTRRYLFNLGIQKAKIYYQSAGVESTMTNWMFDDNTGPVVPLYVPKVYPTETIDSSGISLVPLQYNGQDDSLLKSASEKVKAGWPLRALPSYTGTMACQE